MRGDWRRISATYKSFARKQFLEKNYFEAGCKNICPTSFLEGGILQNILMNDWRFETHLVHRANIILHNGKCGKTFSHSLV